jgi:hypothetical protein
MRWSLVLVVLVVLQVLMLETVSDKDEYTNCRDDGLSRGIGAIKVAEEDRRQSVYFNTLQKEGQTPQPVEHLVC